MCQLFVQRNDSNESFAPYLINKEAKQRLLIIWKLRVFPVYTKKLIEWFST